jgi:hypothetical protein
MKTTFLIITRILLVYLIFIAFPALIQAAAVDGQVKSLKGTARLTLPGGVSKMITLQTIIPHGSTIRTGPDTELVIVWMPGAASVITSNAVVKVDSLSYSNDGSPKRKVGLNLTQGCVFSHLAHNSGTSDFRIKTPAGVAAARGTDWEVEVNGIQVTVSVVTSAVDVTFAGGIVVTVQAGYGFVLDPNGHPIRLTPEQINLIETILQLAGLTVHWDVNQVYNPGQHGTPISIVPVPNASQ